jgi:hypothetical protein
MARTLDPINRALIDLHQIVRARRLSRLQKLSTAALAASQRSDTGGAAMLAP